MLNNLLHNPIYCTTLSNSFSTIIFMYVIPLLELIFNHSENHNIYLE